MTLLKAFNNHLIEFIEDLIKIYPEDLDLKTSHTFITGMIRVNPRIICNYFYKNIALKYKKEFENGDINFFINKDYNEDLGDEWKTNKIHTTMEKWRELLRESSNENKKKSLKYFENLSKLSELYFNS
jgi:hypothetical protein